MFPASRTPLRHGRRRGARASLLLAAPVALALAATPAQAATTMFDNYGCSSTTEPRNVFTVPSHVESLTVRVSGERGGKVGGMGAVVSGRMTVTPGERLYLCVGVGLGDAGQTPGDTDGIGGDGGGLSSISRNDQNSGAFIVAGGGGGKGGGYDGTQGGAAGLLGAAAGGGGGIQYSAGGAGAVGTVGAGLGGLFDDDPTSLLSGRSGSSGQGGNGGARQVANGSNGGGGGGGYYGGGGGAAARAGQGAAGGGGGSSYCNSAQVTDCDSVQATTSSPKIVFTYADEPTATTTTLRTSVNPVISGRDITYTATVSPAPDGGTVTITTNTFHLDEACDNIPVVDGRASCTVPVQLSAGYYDIDADYSGTTAFAPSRGTAPLSVMRETQTLPYLSGSASPAPGAPVTYLADVIPHPTMDLGTVDFTLDGSPIAACQDVAIATGQARCDTTAPGAGRHTLGARYNGSPMFDVSTGSSEFTVTAPAATLTLSDTSLNFGTVTIGGAPVDKLVTLTAGPTAVTISSIVAVPGGSFGVIGDTCGQTLAANATCTIGVRYAPSAAGDHTAQLVVNDNATGGPHLVALTGRAVAATGGPRTGEPRTGEPRTGEPRTGEPRTGEPRTGEPRLGERPSAPKPATVPRSAGGRASVSSAGAVSIPLACPAGATCRVSGTLSVGAFGRAARAAATGEKVIARFKGVTLSAKETRALRLRLPASFVKEAQRRGLRTVRATLTITTVRGSGARVTSRERITLVLPRAAAAPKPAARRPSFTG